MRKELVLCAAHLGHLPIGAFKLVVELAEILHRGMHVGLAQQVEIKVENLVERHGEAAPFGAGRDLQHETIIQECANNAHGADDVFLLQADSDVAVSDLKPVRCVVIIATSLEEAIGPDLEAFLQPLNLGIAGEDSERMRVMGNLLVEPLGHFRQVLFEPRPQLAQQINILLAQPRIPLHFSDKCFHRESF